MKSRVLSFIAVLMLVLARGSWAQNQYYLPQVADGYFGGVSFRTTFIVFNNSNTGIVATLSLTDDAGNPLTVTIGGLGTGSQFTLNLPAGVTGFLQTDGSGTGSVGAATVIASGPIGVSAIFTVFDAAGNYLAEAGVGDSELMAEFVLPVDSAGSSLTGLALYNPGADASLTMTLLNTDGSRADSMVKPLAGGNHTAIFVAAAGQLFPTVSNFRGTLLIRSTTPIAAMVLRQYQSPPTLSYTSLPVVPRSSSKLALNLAQVANGSYGNVSFRTSFLVFNISASPASVKLGLTKDDGSPFTVTIPGNGPGTGTGSSFSLALAVGASVFLQTDGLGAGTSGAATITSNVPVGASAIFTVLNSQGQFQTEAGVGDSPVLTSLSLPVDVTGSFDTGVAFFNPGSRPIDLTLSLLDANGVLAASMARPLAAMSHLATFVDNLFPGTTGFRGSLAVSSTGAVASTTLRQYASGSTYTTLPTAPGTAPGTAQQTVPFLPLTMTGITASASDPDMSISQHLLQASLISGTVSGSSWGLQVIATADGRNGFVSQVNPLTGAYQILVPDGTYSLKTCYQPAGAPNTMSVTVSHVDPDPVQVTLGGTIRDVAMLPVTLSSVSGTVSGISSLLSGGNIVFTSTDIATQGSFALDAGGNYQGLLPVGSYVASISSGAQSLYNLGSLGVGGGPTTANFAMPATVVLSGTVRVGGQTSIPPGAIVTAIDASAPAVAQSGCCTPPASSTATVDQSGRYQMVLAQGRSYVVGVIVPLDTGMNSTAVIDYPVGSSPVSLTGNRTLDFSIPTIRRTVTIFGNVNDGAGHVVADVTVTAHSQSITGAANVGVSVSGKTDIYGNYSIFIPDGTGYELIFTPPGLSP